MPRAADRGGRVTIHRARIAPPSRRRGAGRGGCGSRVARFSYDRHSGLTQKTSCGRTFGAWLLVRIRQSGAPITIAVAAVLSCDKPGAVALRALVHKLE